MRGVSASGKAPAIQSLSKLAISCPTGKRIVARQYKGLKRTRNGEAAMSREVKPHPLTPSRKLRPQLTASRTPSRGSSGSEAARPGAGGNN
jgi:hypothetical protein